MAIVSDVSWLYKYKKEKQLGKFKTEYFASIAHDLRTPIHTLMRINSIFEESANLQEKQLLKVSDSSCKLLLATIDDVFDLSKIELNQF